jgi:hypothetical protein
MLEMPRLSGILLGQPWLVSLPKVSTISRHLAAANLLGFVPRRRKAGG